MSTLIGPAYNRLVCENMTVKTTLEESYRQAIFHQSLINTAKTTRLKYGAEMDRPVRKISILITWVAGSSLIGGTVFVTMIKTLCFNPGKIPTLLKNR